MSSSPYTARHPNDDLRGDRALVAVMVATLILFGLLGVADGLYLGSLGLPVRADRTLVYLVGGGLGLAVSAFYLGAAFAIAAWRSIGAAKAAFVVAAAQLVLFFVGAFFIVVAYVLRGGFPPLALLLSGALAGLRLWLIKRGYDALVAVKIRVFKEEQHNALTAWYHAFIPLLIHVMKADGEIHPAELREMERQCDRMNISPLERKLVFDQARERPGEIDDLVARYMDASGRIYMNRAAERLLVGLAAMAAADRVLQPSEREIIQRIAAALDYAPEEVNIRLDHALADRIVDDWQDALELFDLGDYATPEEIEARYRELCADADPAEYAHVGTDLVRKMRARRQTIEDSYRLLMEVSRPGAEGPMAEA